MSDFVKNFTDSWNGTVSFMGAMLGFIAPFVVLALVVALPFAIVGFGLYVMDKLRRAK